MPEQTAVMEMVWKKQPKQISFLAACGLDHPFNPARRGKPVRPVADVILYGGSAGSGKSDALLIIAFIAAMTFPGCKVGYFRRTFPQLKGPGGAIMRSMELFTGKAGWHGGDHRWTFPGGGLLQFCHCAHEQSVHDYQSQQFDFLLIDEASQFTRFQLRYLITRNRATVDGLVPFAAFATNPGGMGHGYLKREFIDEGEWGHPVSVEIEPGEYETHIFIPARLEDNQVLEVRDPGYRRRLERMPQEIRRALLEGDWSVFAGQYFPTFKRGKDGQPYHVTEPFEIPKGWRRFISMDWGFAAPCAVLWHTIDPAMGRVFTYREIYVTLHRAREVARLINEYSGSEKIEAFYASPDIWQERGLGQGKKVGGETIGEDFRKEGLNPLVADNRRVMGWNRMRDFLSEAPDGYPWWVVTSNCQNLIRTLPDLIHDDKKVEDVDEHCEDHACFVAGTMIETNKGEVPIESVKPGLKVLTRDGFKHVKISQYVGTNPVYMVKLSNGRELVGTHDHPVWVKGKGFVPLINLTPGDKLLSKGECRWNQKASFLTGLHSDDTRDQRIGATGFTTGRMADSLNRVLAIFTKKHGKAFMVKYQQGITFTIKMKIRLTIVLKTLSALLGSIIYQSMVKTYGLTISVEPNALNILTAYDHWPQPGMGRLKAGRWPGEMESSYGRTLYSMKECAINVEASLKQGISAKERIIFVPTTASLPSGERAEQTMLKESVLFAEQNSKQVNTVNQKLVQKNALQVVGICPAGIEKVYNLSVGEKPEYFANGILVHNCEAARYFLMSRPKPYTGVAAIVPGGGRGYGAAKRQSFDEEIYQDEIDDDLDRSKMPGFY